MTHRPTCAHRSAGPAGWIRTGRRRVARYACRCPDLVAQDCTAEPLPGHTTGPGGAMPACSQCPHYREPAPPPATPTATPTAGHWRSLADLARDTLDLAERLPEDLGAIVALPRSGMIPAAILATVRHLPLYQWTTDGPRPTGAGARGPTLYQTSGPALLVDDSICTGRSLALAKHAAPPGTLTAALYGDPHTAHAADYVGHVVGQPHLFEWNLWNSELASRYAFDLDGIICADIDPADDDDGPRYLRAIRNARPRHLLRRLPAKAIITARPETYRTQTAAWLDAHGARRSALIMAPQRMRDPDKIAGYKAQSATDAGAALYVESDPTLAALIHQAAPELAVLCPATGHLYGTPR